MISGHAQSTEFDDDSLNPAVRLRGIEKRFGSIVACDRVDLTLQRGTIHGILGENGAGKSTLMRVLIGLVLPDGGHIEINGVRQRIDDPLAAAELGIGMVHQHFSLVDALTVWENVALGEVRRLNRSEVTRRIGEIGKHYGLDIDPDARVGELTAGLRQRVEIIKCLRRNPSIVIFDEPTSVLTPQESRKLFESFRSVVAAEKRAVVLVSHKLDEVLAATDQITIMRHGAVVDQCPTATADAMSLAHAMVGRDVSLRSERVAFRLLDTSERDTAQRRNVKASTGAARTTGPEPSTPRQDPANVILSDRASVLEIQDAVADIGRDVCGLQGLSLRVHATEILGIAGVEGNGQRALADLLSSLVPLNSGSVMVNGSAVSTRSPGAMAKAGVGVIPEDRHDSGLVLDMSVEENLALVDPDRFARRGIIDRRELRDTALRLINDYRIQCEGPRRSRLVAVGRQPAKGGVGPRTRPPTQGIGGSPAHPRSRYWSNRIHERTAACPSRFRAGDPADLQ